MVDKTCIEYFVLIYIYKYVCPLNTYDICANITYIHVFN